MDPQTMALLAEAARAAEEDGADWVWPVVVMLIMLSAPLGGAIRWAWGRFQAQEQALAAVVDEVKRRLATAEARAAECEARDAECQRSLAVQGERTTWLQRRVDQLEELMRRLSPDAGE